MQAVDREAVLAAEVTVTAAQRQARDAGRREDPEGDGLTEGLGRVIDVAGRAARAHSHRLVLGVDPHALHRRQVDDQAVIDAGETRTIVAAAANGDRELVVAAEIHRRDDIGDVRASGDEQRPLVDHGVVEFSRLFVFRMVAPDNRAAKTLSEFGDGFVVHDVPPKKETLTNRWGWSLDPALAEHGGAQFSPNLDDDVGWYVVAARRGADRLRIRRFIEAIGLSLVGAEEGNYPCHALLVVDPFDAFGRILRQNDLLGKVPLDEITRHAVVSLTRIRGRRSPAQAH